jgi:hypothetical protein
MKIVYAPVIDLSPGKKFNQREITNRVRMKETDDGWRSDRCSKSCVL